MIETRQKTLNMQQKLYLVTKFFTLVLILVTSNFYRPSNGQKCYTPTKPFPKLWGFDLDDTDVQSIAVNLAGSEFYIGLLSKEVQMHGDSGSPTQHLVMKYGLNAESTDPLWLQKVPQSDTTSALPIQVFLFPNEAQLLVIYQSNANPSSAILAILNTSDGSQRAIQSVDYPGVAFEIGRDSILFVSDTQLVVVGKVKDATNPVGLIVSLSFDPTLNTVSLQDTFSVPYTVVHRDQIWPNIYSHQTDTSSFTVFIPSRQDAGPNFDFQTTILWMEIDTTTGVFTVLNHYGVRDIKRKCRWPLVGASKPYQLRGVCERKFGGDEIQIIYTSYTFGTSNVGQREFPYDLSFHDIKFDLPTNTLHGVASCDTRCKIAGVKHYYVKHITIVDDKLYQYPLTFVTNNFGFLNQAKITAIHTTGLPVSGFVVGSASQFNVSRNTCAPDPNSLGQTTTVFQKILGFIQILEVDSAKSCFSEPTFNPTPEGETQTGAWLGHAGSSYTSGPEVPTLTSQTSLTFSSGAIQSTAMAILGSCVTSNASNVPQPTPIPTIYLLPQIAKTISYTEFQYTPSTCTDFYPLNLPNNLPVISWQATQPITLSNYVYNPPTAVTIDLEDVSGAEKGNTNQIFLYAYARNQACASRQFTVIVVDCGANLSISPTFDLNPPMPIAYTLNDPQISQGITGIISHTVSSEYSQCPLYASLFYKPLGVGPFVALTNTGVQIISLSTVGSQQRQWNLTILTGDTHFIGYTQPTEFRIDFSVTANNSQVRATLFFTINFIADCKMGQFTSHSWNYVPPINPSISLRGDGQQVNLEGILVHQAYYEHCMPTFEIKSSTTTLPATTQYTFTPQVTPARLFVTIYYVQTSPGDSATRQTYNLEINVATGDINHAGLTKSTFQAQVYIENVCWIEQFVFSSFTYTLQETSVLYPVSLVVNGPPFSPEPRQIAPTFNCGPIEMILKHPSDPLNLPEFIIDFDNTSGQFKLNPTRNNAHVGLWNVKLELFFSQAMNGAMPNWNANIPIKINPCEVTEIVAPIDYPSKIDYTIGTMQISEYFSLFENKPACGELMIYQINFQNTTIQADLNPSITITSKGKTNIRFGTDNLLIGGQDILEVRATLSPNPNQIPTALISIEVNFFQPEFINLPPYIPAWDTNPSILAVKIEPSDDFRLGIPYPIDDEGDAWQIDINIDSASGFFDYDPVNREIVRRTPLDQPIKEGIYIIKVTLEDLNDRNPKEKEYKIEVTVKDSSSQSEDLFEISENQKDLKELVPHIQRFTSDGLIWVAWNQRLFQRFGNETQLGDALCEVIYVKNKLTGREEAHQGVELWVYDEDYVDFELLNQSKETGRLLQNSGQTRSHKAFYRDERLKFAWKVHKISPNGNFQLKIDFDKIMEVARSNLEPDFLEIIFWHPDLFTTQEGSKVKQEQRLVVQIPPQVKSEHLEWSQSVGETAQTAIYGFVGSQVIVNVLLSGSFQLIWQVLHTLQFIIHLPLISVPFPPMPLAIYTMLISVVQFQLFETEEIVRPIFGLDESTDGAFDVNFNQMKYDSHYFIVNCGTMLFFAPFLLLPYLIEIVARKMGTKIACLQTISNWFKKRIYWNLMIRVLLEASLEIFIMGFIDIYYVDYSSIGKAISSLLSIGFLASQFALLYLLYFRLRPKYNILHLDILKDRWGAIYEDLKMENNPKSLYVGYYFVIRRAIFGFFAIFCNKMPYIQFQLVLNSTLLSMGLYMFFRAHKSKRMMKIELFNDTCLILLVYHVMHFTDVIADPQMRYDIGTSCIILTILTIVVNLALIIQAGLCDVFYRVIKPRYFKIRNAKLLQQRRQQRLLIEENERKLKEEEMRAKMAENLVKYWVGRERGGDTYCTYTETPFKNDFDNFSQNMNLDRLFQEPSKFLVAPNATHKQAFMNKISISREQKVRRVGDVLIVDSLNSEPNSPLLNISDGSSGVAKKPENIKKYIHNMMIEPPSNLNQTQSTQEDLQERTQDVPLIQSHKLMLDDNSMQFSSYEPRNSVGMVRQKQLISEIHIANQEQDADEHQQTDELLKETDCNEANGKIYEKVTKKADFGTFGRQKLSSDHVLIQAKTRNFGHKNLAKVLGKDSLLLLETNETRKQTPQLSRIGEIAPISNHIPPESSSYIANRDKFRDNKYRNINFVNHAVSSFSVAANSRRPLDIDEVDSQNAFDAKDQPIQNLTQDRTFGEYKSVFMPLPPQVEKLVEPQEINQIQNISRDSKKQKDKSLKIYEYTLAGRGKMNQLDWSESQD